MPKMKTSRGAAKRFRRRPNGQFRRAQSHLRHILTKKSAKRKRHLRSMEVIAASDVAGVERMLPYT